MLEEVCETVCNPDDETECLEICCDENARCCVEDDCADCSAADPENFNPDDCVPEDSEEEEERFAFKFKKSKRSLEEVCETICNPDDETECLEICCDENARCCVEDDCADCSAADPENFNPDDCVPEDTEERMLQE